MSGITKVSDKMKKKLSFGDYVLSTELVPVIEPIPEELSTPPVVLPVKARKIYSLSNEDAQKLQEIFSRRSTSSICEIMSEAIDRLHQNVMSNF